MPAQGMNLGGGNFRLAIVVGDGLAQKAATIGSAERFKRVRVQSRTADARKNRIEKRFG